MKFHTVFDVLGYILSITVSRENCLRKRSEYLIILLLYAKWCDILGGKKANTPNRVFIAFDLGETNVYLGGNIGGAGKLKQKIQKERFQWLKDSGLDLGEDPEASPMSSKGGQGYGHCSETIPLVVKML